MTQKPWLLEGRSARKFSLIHPPGEMIFGKVISLWGYLKREFPRTVSPKTYVLRVILAHLKNGLLKSQDPEFRAPDFSGVRSSGLRKKENVDFAAIYFWNSPFLALAVNQT